MMTPVTSGLMTTVMPMPTVSVVPVSMEPMSTMRVTSMPMMPVAVSMPGMLAQVITTGQANDRTDNNRIVMSRGGLRHHHARQGKRDGTDSG